MWMRFVYEFILFALSILTFPKMLYQLIFRKKYRKSLLQRCGKDFPVIDKQGRQLVWMHAVSLGETKAIVPLIKKLKQDHPDKIFIISNTTETGHAEAKKSLPCVDHHLYLPFDFGWLIRPLIAKIKPETVLISESDFWYNFIHASKQYGAKIILVNGKVSEKSTNRFLKVPYFTKALFNLIDLLCVQNNHYKDRFAKLGIPSEKLIVTGNIKLDDPHPRLEDEQLLNWKAQLGIKSDDLVLTFGSSHDPEEKLILATFATLKKQFPNLKLLLVPRHPERFNDVAQLIQRNPFSYQRFSQIQSEGENFDASLILIDAMGLLRKCYEVADVACVGGSWTPNVGGHNILEPSWYGVPVVFGPHMFGQPEMVELTKEYSSGEQVSSDILAPTLAKLLEDQHRRLEMGRQGLKLVNEMKGATNKTRKALETFF